MNLTNDKFISPKEETKLLKAISKIADAGNKTAIVDLFLFQFLSLTGLRISEALAMTWNNVHEDYIFVADSKNGKPRSVDIGNKLMQIIEDFKKVNPYSISPHLFNTQKGPMGRTAAHERLKYWLKVAGLREDISCHNFRHTYATKLLDAGLPLPYVRDQLGHGNIAVTSTYLHKTASARNQLKEAM